jgi:hypothetical protein
MPSTIKPPRVKANGLNQPPSFAALLNRVNKGLYVPTPLGVDKAAYKADMHEAVLAYRATSDTSLLRSVFITYFPLEAKAEEAARIAAEPARLAAEAARLAAEAARIEAEAALIEAEYQERKTGKKLGVVLTYAQATQSLRTLSYADVALMRPEYYTNSVATQVC